MYSFYRDITIDNTYGSELTDYQVRISLKKENFHFFDCQSDGRDIEFRDDDESVLNHYIELFQQDELNGLLWVKVPTITASGTHTIKMYYGSTTSTGISSGSDTFIYFNELATAADIAEFDQSFGTTLTWTLYDDAATPSGKYIYSTQSTAQGGKYLTLSLPENHIIELWRKQAADASGWVGPMTNAADSANFSRPGVDYNWGLQVTEFVSGTPTNKNQYTSLGSEGGGAGTSQWTTQTTHWKPATIVTGSTYIDTNTSYIMQGVVYNPDDDELIVTYDDQLGRYSVVSGTETEIVVNDPFGVSWGGGYYDSDTGNVYVVRFNGNTSSAIYSFDATDLAAGATLVKTITNWSGAGANGLTFDGTYYIVGESNSTAGSRNITLYDTDWNFVRRVAVRKAGDSHFGIQSLHYANGLLYMNFHEGQLEVCAWNNQTFRLDMMDYQRMTWTDFQGIAYDETREVFYLGDRDADKVQIRTFVPDATKKMLFCNWDNDLYSGETTHLQVDSPNTQAVVGISAYRAERITNLKIREYSDFHPVAKLSGVLYNKTNWYDGVSNKFELYIDSSKVDEDVTNFPLNFTISSGTGIDSVDTTAVFDELTSDADRYKIAVTATIDSVETQCFVDIEYWSSSEETATLWASIPTVVSGSDTLITLYYDTTISGNTDYVGDSDEAAAAHVWDDKHIGVWHLSNDPTGTDTIIDATQVNNIGDSGGSMNSADLVDGAVGKCLDFDGSNDYVEMTYNDSSLQPAWSLSTSVFAYREDWDDNSTNYALISKAQSGGYGLQVDGTGDYDNRVSYYCYVNGAYRNAGVARADLSSGWHEFVGTFDGRYTKFYVDGVLVDSYDMGSYGVLDFNFLAHLMFAAESGGTGPTSGFYWNNELDEIRMTTAILEPSLIQTSYYSKVDNLLHLGTTPPVDPPADTNTYIQVQASTRFMLYDQFNKIIVSGDV